MPSRNRVLLVGAGRWGKVFLRNLSAHDRLHLGGIVTSRPEEIHSLPDACELIPNFETALAFGGWEGIILATPPEVHAEQLLQCFDRGIPTLVEKPVALGLGKTQELRRAEAELGGHVLVDHIHLFHPGYELIRERIKKKQSRILNVTSKGHGFGPFRPGYSPLWDYGPHDLSLILDLFGELPRVAGVSATEVGFREGGQCGNYEADLEFSGAMAHFSVGNLFNDKARLFEVETEHEKLTLTDQPVARLSSSGSPLDLPGLSPLANVLNTFADGINGKFDRRWGLSLAEKIAIVIEECERAGEL